MTTIESAIARKAALATGGFKGLITTAGLAALLVVLANFVVDTSPIISGQLFWWCVAAVIFAYLMAGVFFMIWFYAAYQRVYQQSPEALRYKPLWTVLGFSVPVFNLFLPYVLVARLRRQLSGQAQAPAFFTLWWLSHLSVFFAIPATYIACWARLQGDSLATAQLLLAALAVGMIFNAAWLAMRLVKDIGSLFTNYFPEAKTSKTA